MYLHRFTTLVVAASFLLVIAGSLVTSVPSGLIGHRVIGAIVGVLTTLLALAYWLGESRGWVKGLALVALGVVVAQGLVGATIFQRGLPPALSTTHSGLAAIFFALTVSLALFTSRGWLGGYGLSKTLASDGVLRRLAVTSIVLVYLQIVLGAIMRHLGAARAIPDYPLAFGRVLPGLDALAVVPVAVHFAHRLGALALAVVLAAIVWRVVSNYRDRPELVHPALLLAALLPAEVALGALAVAWAPPAAAAVAVSTLLVALGGLILATTVVLALRVHRPYFAKA
jgi:cytochrome c oxidase assembly protein subunit 15